VLHNLNKLAGFTAISCAVSNNQLVGIITGTLLARIAEFSSDGDQRFMLRVVDGLVPWVSGLEGVVGCGGEPI
jgi:hypothetical protein